MKMSGKRTQGRVFGASLFPKPHLNGALSAVTVQSKAYCPGGYRLHANPSTQVMLSDVEEKASPHASCWREFVNVLWREYGPNWYWQWTFSLVVDGDLLGYDLLLGLNAIRQLDGMAMSDTGKVRFPQRERLICAAITLDKPDFHAKYDEDKCVWTASWKWSGDQLLVSLKNRLSEYPTP